MSNLSNLTIELNHSPDFRRIVIVLHLFAIFMVWQSGIPLFFCLLATLMLGLIVIYLWRQARPCDYQIFSYQSRYWRLHTKKGVSIYSHLAISFDGGFFWVIRALEEKRSKTFVVFHDQMTDSQRRTFALFNKMHQSSSAKLRSSLNLW